jgi:hypothetical protein
MPLDRLWHRCRPEPLAAFRVAAALVALGDLGSLLAERGLFFGPDLAEAPVPPPLFAASFAAWSLALVLLLVGRWTRSAACVHWLFTALFFAVGGKSAGFASWRQTADAILLANAFLLVCLPVGRAFALDAARGERAAAPDVARLYHAVFAVTLGMLYIDSGLRKLFDFGMWSRGFGVWAPATLPSVITHPIPWVPDHPLVWRLLGLSTVAFEVLFLPLYALVGWARRLLVLVGAVLHMAIAYVYPIPLFALAC